MTGEEFVKWVNQRTANFFRDHKQQPEPADLPNVTWRATCRLIFLLILATAFALSVTYVSLHGPSVRVDTCTKNKGNNCLTNIINTHVNNTSNDSVIVSCPCTTISISWKDFTNFYILNENSATWHAEYNPSVPKITLPSECSGNARQCDLRNHTVRANQEPATPEMFCSIASMWPLSNTSTFTPNSTVSYADAYTSYYKMCAMLSGKLLANQAETASETASETLLQSPILLTPADSRALVVQQAREPLLITRERAQLLAADSGVNAYNDAITLFMLDVLSSEDEQDWESYLRGARQQADILNTKVGYNDTNAQVLLLNNTEGIAFLHMDINWEKYYEICNPNFCEVTKQLNALRKVVAGFASVGGVMTVILGVVNIVLWPALAYLLTLGGPPTEKSSENEASDLLPRVERLNGSKVVVSIAPGDLQPLDDTKSTQRVWLEKISSRGRETQGLEDK